jgi:hypothetical protein
VDIDQTGSEQIDFGVGCPLAPGQTHQCDRFSFAVVQHRPAWIVIKPTPQPLPQQGLPVLEQGQQRLVTALAQIGWPAAIRQALHHNKAVQEIIPGIWVRFDVVEEQSRGAIQFAERQAWIQPFGLALLLHPGLGHQLGRNLPVLLAMHLQLGGQLLGVRGRQAIEAANPQLQQKFTALSANATDLAEMALCGSGLITKPSPATEGAFLAITDQSRRTGALQVALETHQAVVELVLQASAKGQGLPLKTPTIPSHHQALGHLSLLVISQEAPPEGQLEPVLAGDPAPLAS